MATKLEEANIAPMEGAGLPTGPSAEKQVSESKPIVESAGPDPVVEEKKEEEEEDKKVEDATAGVAGLSVDEKKEEDNKTEELSAAVATAPISAPPAHDAPAPSPAPAPAPAADSTPAPHASSSTGLIWPETAPDHPLTLFYSAFEALVQEASHDEVYGIRLSTSDPFHTKLVLQKFLRANQNDLEKAKQQLLETLKWRKEFDPIKAVSESYEKSKFEGLGYIIEIGNVPGSNNPKDVVTFNIYGAVKDKKATFGDLNA